MAVSSPTAISRAWLYVSDPRRRTVAVAITLAAIGLVVFGVYASVSGPPPLQEAVVYFRPEATQAQKDAARTACPTVGKAIQEPPDRNNLVSSRVYPLRYNVSEASTEDRAAVYACIYRQPGVNGINQETQGQ
ncbi:FtsX extracellular domain-containing protein [Frankia sp. AiPs1]|uniref:hypothetical protein n=1 Tax=Frankia sp. AiPa1 TaxID=573492 RepID=UPI00202B858D|nr:hypothetical protein [Frankia sp. AiPa1]MCL9760801.1 hypothetical protein [Frankia sp. AiPa1]